MLSGQDLLDAIWEGHGKNPDFDIEIRQPRIHHVLEGQDVVLATYIEIQHGAKNSKPSTNARLSTVLFLRENRDARLLWLHVHETALDMNKLAEA